MTEIVIKNWEVSLVRLIQMLIHVPISLAFSYVVMLPLLFLDSGCWSFYSVDGYVRAFFAFDGETVIANTAYCAGNKISSLVSIGSIGVSVAWAVFVIGSAIQIIHEFARDIRKAYAMKLWIVVHKWALTLRDDFNPKN